MVIMSKSNTLTQDGIQDGANSDTYELISELSDTETLQPVDAEEFMSLLDEATMPALLQHQAIRESDTEESSIDESSKIKGGKNGKRQPAKKKQDVEPYGDTEKRKTTFSFNTQTLADIELGAKKYGMNKSEYITFAVHCHVNELTMKQQKKLLEDKERIVKIWGAK
jgi:hypothetical protein